MTESSLEEASPPDLRRTVAEQGEHIVALRERVDYLAGREAELQDALRRAEAELEQRERDARKQIEGAMRERDERLLALDDEVRSLNRTIQMMQATRAWQLGERYWRVRDALKRRLRRP